MVHFQDFVAFPGTFDSKAQGKEVAEIPLQQAVAEYKRPGIEQVGVLPALALQREGLAATVSDMADAAAVPAAGRRFAGTIAQQHQRQVAVGEDAEGDGALQRPGGGTVALEGEGGLPAAESGGLLQRGAVHEVQAIIAADGKTGLPGQL